MTQYSRKKLTKLIEKQHQNQQYSEDSNTDSDEDKEYSPDDPIFQAKLTKLITEQDPTITPPNTPPGITHPMTPPHEPAQQFNIHSVSEEEQPHSLTQEFESLYDNSQETTF